MIINIKKLIKILIIIAVILLIALFIINNFSVEKTNDNETNNIYLNEIEPQAEVNENEEKQTTIQLYFIDKTSQVLVAEKRTIEIKYLINDPYLFVLEELLKGPESENLLSPIPQNTKVNNMKFEKGILTIDLSKDFLNFSGTDAIESIKKTMKQFNEINEVKILIDGETNEKIN